MKVFENDIQLAAALRVLSEAGLMAITVDDDGVPRYELSGAIVAAAGPKLNRE